MSLRHLLRTNHCVAEGRDKPGKYKVVKRGWLPKFGLGPSFRSSNSANPSSQTSDVNRTPAPESPAEKEAGSGSTEEEREERAESGGDGEGAVHQTELDLRWRDERFSHLQAIRNDLSDMDLELVSRKPARVPFRERVPAAANELVNRVQNTLAWEGVATRLLAVSKFLF
jgi:hypothetical protein